MDLGQRLSVFWQREFDGRELALGCAVLLPSLLLFLLTGAMLWFQCAFVAMAMLIVQRRAGASFGLLLVHALLSALAMALFFFALRSPLAFVGVVTLAGFASLRLALLDERLLSLGTYSFIPPLYIACDLAGPANGPQAMAALGAVLGVWPVALASVALVLRPPWKSAGAGGAVAWRRWLGLAAAPLPQVDPGQPARLRRASWARAASVMLAAAYIEWRGLHDGQWTVWSAASVANADSALALTKFKNRAAGVLAGVAAGLLLGPHVPAWPALYGLAMVCIFLTITVIRRYVFSYGARCFFVTLAAFSASQGSSTASDRVFNVLVGGAIGLAVTALFIGVTRRQAVA
jgi:hypothetical protein